MNSQINFSLPEKSIYQMGFNSTAPTGVPNYVTESNSLTNPLQILEMLNPQNQDADDRKRQFFAELMAPHYEKQLEIEKKVDGLQEMVQNFIRGQQSVNELVIERYLRQSHHESPQNLEDVENTTKMVEEEDLVPINNPLPVYPVPICVNQDSAHSPIRNRSISPEKMDVGGISVRDFLKNNMTVQKADDKILEMERQRDREEEAQAVKYNKFRVRNRPKKYKRSAVTVTNNFSSTTNSTTSSEMPTAPVPTTSSEGFLNDSSRRGSTEQEIHEESAFQPVMPCAQRPPDLELALMQPVFPTTSSYVLNAPGPPPAIATEKFPGDPNNLWKAVDGVTQLLVDAPSLLDSDLRSFADPSTSSHHSFLPFMSTQDHHPRSAFVPPNYHKDRLIQMDPNLDTLRNL